MIEVTDVRKGNAVLYEDRIFEIDTIAEEFPTLNTIEFGIGVVSWNTIEPILLTQEMLIRLGFERVLKGYKFIWVNKSYYMFLQNNWYFVFKKDGCISFIIGNQFVKHFKYVHELQNFYYFITCGNEIKLKKI